jgi:uncharacterized cupin superfamily protein
MQPFQVVRLDEIPSAGETEPDEASWKPVRHHLGIEAFGAGAYVADAAGDTVVPEHDEAPGDHIATTGGHEELYVVLVGRATFTVDGAEIDAAAGTLVFVRDPALTRSAVAREAGTSVLAIGGAPGEPFAVSPWEQKAVRG